MLILIAGESGSGKTTFVNAIAGELDAVVLTMDSFYFGVREMPRTSDVAHWGNDPAYCDRDTLIEVITRLKMGELTAVPQYSFVLQDKIDPLIVKPREHIIVEGLWALTFEQLRNVADLKIYIDASEEVRIHRRIKRDGARGHGRERVLGMASIIEQLGTKHVIPYKQYADIVIDNNGSYFDRNQLNKVFDFFLR